MQKNLVEWAATIARQDNIKILKTSVNMGLKVA